MRLIRTIVTISTLMLIPLTVLAQVPRDVPLKPWPAPLYWQPSPTESQFAPAATITELAADTRPANSLVFVAMTPCRVVDTRIGSGFTGAFGSPSLVGGAGRTFPIQSSATCSVPSIAQAYSFNITVVPSGFLDYLTVWPTGQARPNASTLNAYVNTVIANAAIVAAGIAGSVDVYASQSTDLIIDINGYYALQTGIALEQGTAVAPSLSFSGNSDTGIFSSGPGTLNFATSGANRVTVDLHGNVGIGTSAPAHHLGIAGGPPWTNGWAGALSLSDGSALGWHSNSSGQSVGIGHRMGGLYFFRTENDPGTTGSPANYDMVIDDSGNIGMGTLTPLTKLEVDGDLSDGVYGTTNCGKCGGVVGKNPNGPATVGVGSVGVWGYSPYVNGWGVAGEGELIGVSGHSAHGTGVEGSSGTGYAGYFYGNVNVTGTITQNSDARLKQKVTGLDYGLAQILQLRPVTYEWKDRPDRGRQLGLIAQEVETVLPELVTTDKDSEQTKGVNYIALVPVTIKAIQEQQAQIQEQHTQIENQQKRITEQQEQILQQQEENRKLEERLAALEALLSAKVQAMFER
jgi:endosialidase-like protein